MLLNVTSFSKDNRSKARLLSNIQHSKVWAKFKSKAQFCAGPLEPVLFLKQETTADNISQSWNLMQRLVMYNRGKVWISVLLNAT
jgi:hypothetical protein